MPTNGDEGNRFRTIGLAITIPMMLGASVLVGTFIGFYLDRWLGTSPWLLLLFLVLGIVTGIREMLAIIRRMSQK